MTRLRKGAFPAKATGPTPGGSAGNSQANGAHCDRRVKRQCPRDPADLQGFGGVGPDATVHCAPTPEKQQGNQEPEGDRHPEADLLAP